MSESIRNIVSEFIEEYDPGSMSAAAKSVEEVVKKLEALIPVASTTADKGALDLEAIEQRLENSKSSRKGWGDFTFTSQDDIAALVADVKRLRGIVGTQADTIQQFIDWYKPMFVPVYPVKD